MEFLVSDIDKFKNEVRFVSGEVIGDSKLWAETHVRGSGGGQNGHLNISSSNSNWSSFLIETNDDKEIQIKFPMSLAVRPGHKIEAAVFRGLTLAYKNHKTDEEATAVNCGNLVIKKNETTSTGQYFFWIFLFPAMVIAGLVFLAIGNSAFVAPAAFAGMSSIVWILIVGSRREGKPLKVCDKLAKWARKELQERSAT